MPQTVTQFLWPVRVYYEDTDAGGVVYYANYLKFMERARTEWLRARGLEQDVLRSSQGIIFAVRAVELDFLRPARFNELLEVRTSVVQRGKASLTFGQVVARSQAMDTVLCEGRIKVACVDAETLRARPIPKQIYRELFSDH